MRYYHVTYEGEGDVLDSLIEARRINPEFYERMTARAEVVRLIEDDLGVDNYPLGEFKGTVALLLRTVAVHLDMIDTVSVDGQVFPDDSTDQMQQDLWALSGAIAEMEALGLITSRGTEDGESAGWEFRETGDSE